MLDGQPSEAAFFYGLTHGARRDGVQSPAGGVRGRRTDGMNRALAGGHQLARAGLVGNCQPTMNDIEKNRLLKIVSASSQQLAAIDRILDGRLNPPPAPEPPRGPLLLRVKDAASLLGVHRATIWRLVRAGRLDTVELLGSQRVRRADVEALAGGHHIGEIMRDEL